jgi:transcriptional regulator with XRE-family HTH domain
MPIDRDGAGGRIREVRERYGWSLQSVAKGTGINPGTLFRIEQGQRRATDEQVAKLAEYLRVREVWLWGLEE